MPRGKIPEHLPAKSLLDIELDEKVYKADFEVATRYHEVAKELERLALLGIGAYGFFMTKSEIPAKHFISATYFHVPVIYVPAIGLVALGVCAGCALICTDLNTLCLKLQLDILRLLDRVRSGRWEAPDEQVANTENLKFNRAYQKRLLWMGKWLIRVAVGGLIVGALATVLCFVLTLWHRAGR